MDYMKNASKVYATSGAPGTFPERSREKFKKNLDIYRWTSGGFPEGAIGENTVRNIRKNPNRMIDTVQQNLHEYQR